MTSTYSSLAPAPSTAFYGSSVPPAYPPPLSSVPYSTPLPPINPLGPSFATQTYNYGMPYANCNNYPYVNFNTNPFYSYPPSNPSKTIPPSTMKYSPLSLLDGLVLIPIPPATSVLILIICLIQTQNDTIDVMIVSLALTVFC